jgi:hypothetical protein
MNQVQQHRRKKAVGVNQGGNKALSTLTLLIPVYYNPTSNGVVLPVESWKHRQTEAEIRQRFTGYSVSSIDGWYRSPKTGEEFHDRNLRFEIDLIVTASLRKSLSGWKIVLEKRFKQRAIYMKLSAPITWI